VDIEIRGGDTRLDQKVLENIEAPLVHLVRNAVDHGIETPAERRKRGKSERGSIRLTALREGGHIAITVEDDGGGLDPAKLKETAVRAGVLSETEAQGLSDREAPYLVCVKGFSTAPTVTEVSGRGVGMDVVKRVIEECKGELLIDSTLGTGTTFKMALPLTLAVTQALMVEVGGQSYCIPTLSIEMVRLIEPEEVQLVADRPVIKVGRRSVPLVKLANVLRVGGSDEVEFSDITPVVFLAHARQRIAFAVDRLLAEQQIVIKSFGKLLRNVSNVAGATILGTGEVAIILHTPDLVRHGLAHAGKTVPMALPGRAVPSAREPRTILVVEDALSTREMERDILESAGLSVETAVNGLEALEKSRRTHYGLFLVDVQMPVMGGFELVEALRSSEQYAHTPIVFITSLSSEADRRRGLELGADAYLSKSEFNPDLLLDVVERFMGGERGVPRGSAGDR
jgi:two-component system chemotaxis sensor kinase CheA